MIRAEDIARTALARVVGLDVVQTMRADTPLAGVRPADAVALAMAVAECGASSGVAVELTDDDLASIRTLADLMSAVEMRMRACTDA